MSGSAAFTHLAAARERFLEADFDAARRLVAQYRAELVPDDLPREDRRAAAQPVVSVIVVSWGGGEAMLACLDSILAQDDGALELILIDNGDNESVREALAERALLHVRPPFNVLPSAARNLGVHFARGRYVVFIDDDALIMPGYLASVRLAFESFEFAAVRGRVIPFGETSNNRFVGHYDIGPFPVPAVLSTEGNMAMRADVFRELGGFDPLMFGSEGAELSWRCQQRFPEMDIYYWPGMLIRHDYSEGPRLEAKAERQALARRYCEWLSPEVNELMRDYGRWYQRRPGGALRYDSRGFGDKLQAFAQVWWMRARRAMRGRRPPQG